MIIISDIHWDKITDSVLVKTKDGTIQSQLLDVDTRMQEIYNACLEGNHSLVIAGDLFNKVNPPTNIIARFMSILWLFVKAGIHVYILPGNHDCGSNWANVSMLDGMPHDKVHVITTPQEGIVDGQEVLFVPHIAFNVIELLKEKNGTFGGWLRKHFGDHHELIITHGQVVNLNYSNDIFFEAGDALEIDPNVWPSFDLMITGHVHKHHEMMEFYSKNKTATIVYPGSLRITNFGEVDDEKGYITFNGPRDWIWEPYESEITPYVDLTIDLVNKDEIDLSDKTVSSIAKDAVIKIKVVTRDRLLVDEPAIRRAFNKFGHVSRFETVVEKEGAEIDGDELFTELSHMEQLKEYISGMKSSDSIKKLATKLGGELISEVLGD